MRISSFAAHPVVSILCQSLLLLFTFSISAHAKDKDNGEPYKLTQQDHPLVGKIWDVNKQQYISKDQLLQNVLISDYILLGETHDNIKHHEDHGWVISELNKKGLNIAVALEMVTKEQAETINSTENATTDNVMDALEKAKTGWEFKKYYRPVFDSIVNANYKIYPADLDKPTMMKVVREGKEHAPAELKSLLKTKQLSEEERAALKKEIEGTHCGMINDEMTKAMMLGQQVRDAAMANNMFALKDAETQAVVLISGSGHVRNDRGAPMYLSAIDKTASITSIAWLEVDEETTDPKIYATPWGQEKLPFDYVVFTPAADRPDPCEEMKKFMEHKHKKSQGKKES
ncbi:ChaN family lipoprotein [Kaarinaea lacus]